MDQITLTVTDNVRRAMDYAFDEAQEWLKSEGGFLPFTVTVVDEGLEVNEHPGDSPEEVRESVKILLAQDMPEGYALCYDGYVETDDGTLDALMVEVADRGSARADVLAMLYSQEEDGSYTFEPSYAYAGAQDQLYPAGTKPIVSGLSALNDDADVDEFADDPDEAPEAVESGDAGDAAEPEATDQTDAAEPEAAEALAADEADDPDESAPAGA